MRKYISNFTGDVVECNTDAGIKIPATDIVEYQDIDVVKKTGDGETDFVIEVKTVEASRVNRQKYIDSFSNDVGIQNILKKLALGDPALLDQFTDDGVTIDFSQLPDNYLEAIQYVQQKIKAYKDSGIDVPVNEALVNDDAINSYIDRVIAERLAAANQKEEGEVK